MTEVQKHIKLIDIGRVHARMTHDAKSCTERPRRKGAKLTSMFIAPDEKIEDFELDYDGKRDRWNGYDVANYSRDILKRHEAMEDARKSCRKEKHLEMLEENCSSDDQVDVGDEDVEYVLKLDEIKQTDFAKFKKRVRTTGGGSTGTVRNLRIREDLSKYLFNLDVNSAHYAPKTRSMRDDPLPNEDPVEKFYGGDNQNRMSGQAMVFKELSIHALEAYERGQDVHMQGAPSQAERLFKTFIICNEKRKSTTKDTIMEKYGNAANVEELPKELLFGQSERHVEYDRAGIIIKFRGMTIQQSQYEDLFINNHTSVWGSWWKDYKWGYKCCQQTIKDGYCTTGKLTAQIP